MSFIAAGSAWAPVHAQQQGQLYMSVLDATGAPVTDLETADVSVQVDEVDCRVLKVEPVGKPMKLTVMVDNGPAMANALSNLRTALRNFFEALPEEVEASLLTIAPQPRWIVRPTTDRPQLLRGIDLVSPDAGAGLFFDALVEAANRADKDKTDHFPMLVMISTDVGRNDSARDRDYQRLLRQITERAMTVHFVVLNTGGERVGSVAGALQTQVGLAVTQRSGGRYENIAAHTRLITLLPEIAKQIAESNLRQTHQYRITYERPGKDSKPPEKIMAGVSGLRIGMAVQLSLDGHMPVTGAP
jgi:hypothetical protein